MAVKTQQELYDDFINELQSQAPELTDLNEGSMIDVHAGVTSFSVSEVLTKLLDKFRQTFFETANGPEVTGGFDELEYLALDHFGPLFARPGAVKATGTVTFSRTNTDAGNVVIPAGTIVKTAANAVGTSQRYETVAQVILTGTSINASVRAITPGVAGNVSLSTVKDIESALTDSSVTVNNAASFAGGEAAETDAEYRETIRNLLLSLKGTTVEAIEAAAKTVGGVEYAKGKEFIVSVKEWDEANDVGIGDVFKIVRAKLYVSDANGTASVALKNDVRAAISNIRALGVNVEVFGAIAVALNWTANITLNPSGANYATLQTDASMIVNDMIKYIQYLEIGSDFVRTTARNYIMAKYGPSGTNDLTEFQTIAPTGDISTSDVEKIIPGTVSV